MTPKSRRHVRVDAQSAAVEKFEISESPLASAAMSAARWEMDLSPGSWIRPVIRRAGASFMWYKDVSPLTHPTPSAGFPPERFSP